MKSEESKSDGSESDGSESEQRKPEQSKTEASKSEQSKTEPRNTEENKSVVVSDNIVPKTGEDTAFAAIALAVVTFALAVIVIFRNKHSVKDNFSDMT